MRDRTSNAKCVYHRDRRSIEVSVVEPEVVEEEAVIDQAGQNVGYVSIRVACATRTSWFPYRDLSRLNSGPGLSKKETQ
jgi:hypothetical protein